MPSSPHLFRHQAMATTFEIRIAEGDAKYASQAAEDAFRQLDHLENLLSRFRESSDVSAIAQLAPGESVRVSPETFECLAQALEINQLTGGAFDPTLGVEMDLQRDETPTPPELSAAKERPRGSLFLDPATLQVSCAGAAVHLDLGAVGKGFAVDKLGELLREWSVGPALVVGGGSSILATEQYPEGWTIGITTKLQMRLMHGSIGCSGLAVKGAHILDPRTGTPAVTPARLWVLFPTATTSDALSTAFMVMPEEDIREICLQRPDIGAIIQLEDRSAEIHRIGRAIAVNYGFENVEHPH